MQLSGQSLEKAGSDRENNLDFIRFAAAWMVIISHSFPLTMGASYSDPVSVWTNGSLSIGGIAVGIFLLMGGYLITGSMLHRKTARAFFKARCLRIFPELVFVVFACALILGPILSSYSTIDYYTSSQTWLYLLNSIFILQHNLPGVFVSNIYPGVVNGPLWVLPLEFGCYVLCYICYKLGLLQRSAFKPFFIFCTAAAIAFFIVTQNNNLLISVARPIYLFIIGSGAYLYRDKVILDVRLALVSFLLLCLAVFLRFDIVGMVLFFPYPFLYIAFGTKRTLSAFAKHGELSYGMFLWGWPIQQTLCLLSSNSMAWHTNALIACILCIGFGELNYVLIEKPLKFLQNRHV